jgi:carbon-monoxide dehydrogenase medium subunit
MKPAPFRYLRPSTITDALAALASEAEAKVIAGGQSLIAMMNLRAVQPKCVIDINRLVELDYIREDGDALAIGALARHNAIKASPLVAQYCPLLTEACGYIANKTVRNRGTLGGNVCHADPASETPAVLLATEATLVARSIGAERRLPAEEFFRGIFETALGPNELLTEIRIPKRVDREGWAIEEVSPRKGDFAMAVVAATLVIEGTTCKRLRLSAAGIGDRARRIRPAEQFLQGRQIEEGTLQETAAVARDAVDPFTDHHADAAYRHDLVFALTKRAVAKAFAQVQGGD